ncbi:MAG: tetratricopeptide repeat protein [Thermoguttaceae bacterium]|jgi:predicted Zn-dependent protease|nr:tetratricopeptide repeat protein [Thermoguttaceae bacterium]
MPTVDELYDEAIKTQQQGDLDGGIAKLRDLLASHPDYALAHGALSVFYSKREQYDEAIEHAQRVCELEPEDPFSFVALSLVCQKAGRIAEAEQALWQARQASAQARFRT